MNVFEIHSPCASIYIAIKIQGEQPMNRYLTNRIALLVKDSMSS